MKINIKKPIHNLKYCGLALILAVLYFYLPFTSPAEIREARAAITVVGTPQVGFSNNGGTKALTFSTRPSTGDVTIACAASPAATPAYAKAPTEGGYSILASFMGSGNTQPSMGCWYKVQGGTTDTTATLQGDGAATTDTTAIAFVLRGVNTSNVIDNASTTAGVTTSTNPDPAQIVTQTDGAWVIVVAASVQDPVDTAVGTISGYTNHYQAEGGDTYDHTHAMATKEVATAGTEEPGAWSAWDSGNWYAMTFAVKPAVPPATPTTPGHTSQLTTSMRWTWVSGGTQTGYNYGPNSTTFTGTTTNAYWDESSLSANTAYTRYARAYDSNIPPQYSSALTIGPYYTSNNTPTCSAANDSASQITITQSGEAVNLGSGSSGVYMDCTGVSCDTGINAWVQVNTDSATGLNANASYTFQVNARNGDTDETGYGATCSTYTSANTPGAPTVNTPTVSTLNVNPVSGGTETSMAIYVEAGAACDGTGGLGYVQADGSVSGTDVWQADGTWSTITVTGRSANTQYSFCTSAKNADGDTTSWSTATSLYTSANTPTTPGHTNQTDIAMRWTWVSGGAQTGYNYGTNSTTFTGTTTNAYWDEASLTANTQYTRYARAYNGESSPVYTGVLTIGPYYTSANTPGAPTVNTPTVSTLNVNPVSGGTETSMAIYVEAGAACDGTGGLGYVQADGSVSGTDVWQADGTWSTVTVTGRSANTQYSFCVSAKNADGDMTSWSTATTLYTTANTPAAPTVNNLTASTLDVNPVSGGAEDSMAIYVEQGAACDGTGGLGYVQANGSVAGGEIWQTDVTWNTVTVTGLIHNTQYAFCARAKNGNGDMTDWGLAASFSTLPQKLKMQGQFKIQGQINFR